MWSREAFVSRAGMRRSLTLNSGVVYFQWWEYFSVLAMVTMCLCVAFVCLFETSTKEDSSHTNIYFRTILVMASYWHSQTNTDWKLRSNIICSMTIYVCTKILRTYSILEMKNSHVMAWSSFTLAQTKDDIKKCEGKPAIMRTKAGFHYIEKWVSKSQKWKKSRKKENYANSIVQRFKTTNSLRFRKRSGCIQLTIGGILNHKMRKWMNKQKEKKSSSMTFCWRKVIENKGIWKKV